MQLLRLSTAKRCPDKRVMRTKTQPILHPLSHMLTGLDPLRAATRANLHKSPIRTSRDPDEQRQALATTAVSLPYAKPGTKVSW